MAITWQNVAQPNLGSPVNDMAIANEALASAGRSVLDGLQGFREMKKNKARNSLQDELLDMSLNATDEKQFLADAIKLGKGSGLNTEDMLKQVEAVNATRAKLMAPTEIDRMQIQAMRDNLAAFDAQSKADIAAFGAEFDANNSQARQLIAEVDQFEASGGLGNIWKRIDEQIEDGGDRAETRDAINKLIDEGGYTPYVAGKALDDMGVEEEGFIFDGNLIDSKAFKRKLNYYQNMLDGAKAKGGERQGLIQQREQLHIKEMAERRQGIIDFTKQLNEQYRSTFTSK